MHVVNLSPHEISADVAARFDVKVQQGKEGLPLPESEMFRQGIGGSLGAFVMGTEEQQKTIAARHQEFEARRVAGVHRCAVRQGAGPHA